MRTLWIAAAALVLAAMTTGCGSVGTGDAGYVPGGGTVTEFEKADRRPIKNLTGRTVSGDEVSLRLLARGRPTVVNVWADWCAECRSESKQLRAAAKQLGSRAAFLGVSVRSSSKDNVRAFNRTYKLGYPSIYDPAGTTLLNFPRGVAAQAMPSTVVLDSRGRVSASIFGAVPSARTLVELVNDAD